MARPAHILALALSLQALALCAQTTRPSPAIGDELPSDELLAVFAEKYNTAIVKAAPLDKKIVVTESLPADRDEAFKVLSRLLAPIGYNALPRRPPAGLPPSPVPVITIVTGDEARKLLLAEGPVTTGTDASKIDVSDRTRLVTHVLPLTRSDLSTAARRTASQDQQIDIAVAGDPAEAGGVQFIITGPAARVKAAVEAILTIDTPAAVPLVKPRQMKNLSAQTAADALARHFGQGPADHALRALADKGSNTVILSGPDLVVAQALIMLEELDKNAPKPRLEFHLPPNPSGSPGARPAPAATLPDTGRNP